jgi:hypothetical protein
LLQRLKHFFEIARQHSWVQNGSVQNGSVQNGWVQNGWVFIEPLKSSGRLLSKEFPNCTSETIKARLFLVAKNTVVLLETA